MGERDLNRNVHCAVGCSDFDFFTFWGITTHPSHRKGPRIWKLAKKIFQLHPWPAEIFGKNRKMRFFGLVSKFNFRSPVWQIFTIFSACFIYEVPNTHTKFEVLELIRPEILFFPPAFWVPACSVVSFSGTVQRLKNCSMTYSPGKIEYNCRYFIMTFRTQIHTQKFGKNDFHTLQGTMSHPRRLIRSSRPTEIFQPPQQGFFSVHAQLQLLGNIFQLFTPHPTSPQLTSHLTTLTLWFYI